MLSSPVIAGFDCLRLNQRGYFLFHSFRRRNDFNLRRLVIIQTLYTIYKIQQKP